MCRVYSNLKNELSIRKKRGSSVGSGSRTGTATRGTPLVVPSETWLLAALSADAPCDRCTILVAVFRQLWCWNPAEKAGVSEADSQRPARPPQ